MSDERAIERLPVLTLDTMCVHFLASGTLHADPAELVALSDLYDAAQPPARIELQITPSQTRDTARMKDETLRTQREEWLATASMFVSPGVARWDVSVWDGDDVFASGPMSIAPGAFRLDVSVIGGPDLIAGDNDVALDAKLRDLLGGKDKRERIAADPSPDPAEAAKAFSDMDHLMSHRLSGADAFVTLDSELLGKRDDLASEGVVVLRPTEAAARFL